MELGEKLKLLNNSHGQNHITCSSGSLSSSLELQCKEAACGLAVNWCSFLHATSVCLLTRTRIAPEPSQCNKPSCTLVCSQLQKMDVCPQCILSLHRNGKEFLILPIRQDNISGQNETVSQSAHATEHYFNQHMLQTNTSVGTRHGTVSPHLLKHIRGKARH